MNISDNVLLSKIISRKKSQKIELIQDLSSV